MRIQVQKHKSHMLIFVVCIEISKKKKKTLKPRHGITLPPQTPHPPKLEKSKPRSH
jgi:hypothetical protein